MRIITGKAKGRRLVGPSGVATRPPTARMREGVFSSLGGRVQGAAVLDLFAGSGSFGLEALSRGAGSVVFVERDRAALKALRTNITAVGLGGRVVAGTVAAALEREHGRYDVVFVDPPYELGAANLEEVLVGVAALAADGAIVVVHRRRGEVEPTTRGTLMATGRRRYGDAEIWWYEKEAQ